MSRPATIPHDVRQKYAVMLGLDRAEVVRFRKMAGHPCQDDIENEMVGGG